MLHQKLFFIITVYCALLTAPVRGQDVSYDALGYETIRAQLVAREFTTLANEIPVKIDRIKVREGETFSKGDVLITLDCAIQRAELSKSKLVTEAAAKVVEVNKRLKTLNSIGELDLYLSESELAKAKSDNLIIQAIVEKCTILAPFAGRVVEQHAREKQYLEQGRSILEISNTEDLEVSFLMPSLMIGKVGIGDQLSIQIEETGVDYPITITQLGAQVDPVSRTIEVRGQVVGDSHALLPGMSGIVLGLTGNE